MNLEHYMIIIAQGLAEVLQRGKVCHLEQGFMTEAERGWSGAEVRRLEVAYENGNKESLIFKKATLKERMAIEDVGSVKSPPSGTDWSPRVAEALARIHARNMGRGSEMPWLPQADRQYWENY